MKKTIGFILLAGLAVSVVGYVLYTRRWRKYDDFNFVGNQTFSNVGFVTNYDTNLAVGDKVEIKQDAGANKVEAYEGIAEVTGFTKNAAGDFIFVTDKPWTVSRPKNGGSWRKLNVI